MKREHVLIYKIKNQEEKEIKFNASRNVYREDYNQLLLEKERETFKNNLKDKQDYILEYYKVYDIETEDYKLRDIETEDYKLRDIENEIYKQLYKSQLKLIKSANNIAVYEIEKNNRILTSTPYNDDYRVSVKKLNAKWNAGFKMWEIDKEYSKELFELLSNIYGLEMNTEEKVNIEFNGLDFYEDRVIKINNLIIVRRDSRDKEVTCINSFKINKEDFEKRGGSSKRPDVKLKKDSIIRGSVTKTFLSSLNDEDLKKITIK